MIGGIVDRKQHLGTDSWGSNDTNVREIMEPAELAVEREYPNFERFPSQAKLCTATGSLDHAGLADDW